MSSLFKKNHTSGKNHQQESDEYFDNLVSEYINCSTEKREVIRRQFIKKDCGNFLSQSHKFAVEAVRKNNVALVKKGLILQSIENAQFDWRDNLVTITLLYNSARKLNENPDDVLREIAGLSDSRMKDLLINYIKRKESLKTLECMGYKEVYEPDFDYVQLLS